MRIILASTSEERKKVIGYLGIDFECIPSNYDESFLQETIKDPYELVVRIAEEKAKYLADEQKDAIIISGDTVGCFEGEFLCKPKSLDEARDMLMKLSGKTHKFISGFCVINTGTGEKEVGFSECDITFRDLSENEINEFLKEGISLKKASGYQIFGAKSESFIEKINGSLHACNGIPIEKIILVLRKYNVKI
jgi:septum formation protein